jgi:putative addiction module component (TIGR02574 family)
MDQTSIPEPPGFADLSKAEQIRYLQVLWNRISEHPDDVPTSESQIQLAEERLAEHRLDPSRVRPANEVIDRLSRKVK